MKLALYGLSGSGKSTVAAALNESLTQRGHRVEVVKLAAPLYRLQASIYATAGRDIGPWEHDNELLRTLARQLRRINPDFIADDFLRRVRASTADVVINDDLRDGRVDYPRLVTGGFRFLQVSCNDEVRAGRAAARGDRTVVPDSDAIWGYDQITPDWTVDTTSLDQAGLHHHAEIIVAKWLAEHPRLLPPRRQPVSPSARELGLRGHPHAPSAPLIELPAAEATDRP
jgi:dephospho-CoA kinase